MRPMMFPLASMMLQRSFNSETYRGRFDRVDNDLREAALDRPVQVSEVQSVEVVDEDAVVLEVGDVDLGLCDPDSVRRVERIRAIGRVAELFGVSRLTPRSEEIARAR